MQIIDDYARKRQAAFGGRDRQPLKYLTLPGANATDIGLLWQAGILEKTLDGKLNVAICDQESADTVVANLNKLGGLLTYSNRRLNEELRDSKGSLRKFFPFDIINLDTCSPVIPANATVDLQMLQDVFRLQLGQSFLLLLTTKPDPAAGTRMDGIISNNLEEEESFRDAYQTRYGTADLSSCKSDFTTFTQMAVAKYVAKHGRNCGYLIREHFVARYPRKNAAYEMICHSFELEFLGRKEDYKKYEPYFRRVATNPVDDLFFNELSSKVKTQAISEYSTFVGQLPQRPILNIDLELNLNPTLSDKLQQEAEALIGWWENE